MNQFQSHGVVESIYPRFRASKSYHCWKSILALCGVNAAGATLSGPAYYFDTESLANQNHLLEGTLCLLPQQPACPTEKPLLIYSTKLDTGARPHDPSTSRRGQAGRSYPCTVRLVSSYSTQISLVSVVKREVSMCAGVATTLAPIEHSVIQSGKMR